MHWLKCAKNVTFATDFAAFAYGLTQTQDDFRVIVLGKLAMQSSDILALELSTKNSTTILH